MCFPLSLSSFQIENSLYLANFLSELHKSLHVKAPAAEFIQSGEVFLPTRFCGACCEGKWVWIRQAALHGKKIRFLRPHARCMRDALRVISTCMIIARHWEGSGQSKVKEVWGRQQKWRWTENDFISIHISSQEPLQREKGSLISFSPKPSLQPHFKFSERQIGFCTEFS